MPHSLNRAAVSLLVEFLGCPLLFGAVISLFLLLHCYVLWVLPNWGTQDMQLHAVPCSFTTLYSMSMRILAPPCVLLNKSCKAVLQEVLPGLPAWTGTIDTLKAQAQT